MKSWKTVFVFTLASTMVLATVVAPAWGKGKSRRQQRIERHLHFAEYLITRERNLDAAMAEYQKVLRLDRDNIKAGLGLAHAYVKTDAHKKAVTVLERLARRHRRKPDTRVLRALGRARLKSGDRKGALAIWQKAIEVDPRDDASHFNIFSVLMTRYRAGETDLRARALAAAEAYLKVARLKRGLHYRVAKRAAVELSGDAIALAIFDGTRAYQDAFATARYGTINKRMGVARKHFEACLDKEPKNQTCHYWLGKVQSSVKASAHYDLDAARKHFQAASAIPDAHVQLAIMLRAADEIPRAAKQLQAALALDANHQAALVELAVVRKLQGKEQAAKRYLVAAYRADPRSAFASEAIAELAKIDPRHRLVKARAYFGRSAGDVFSTERFAAAVELIEKRLGGVDAAAPEQAALDTILARLMSVADVGSEHEIRVRVLRSKIPNAFALPNGSVYFTRGLLDYVAKRFPKEPLDADNDVVAFVMAHELSHVIHEHTLRSSVFAEAVRDARRRLDPAVLTHVTRLHEIEADRGAIVLTFVAGYHPRGGIRLMEEQGRDREIPQHLNHPTYDERIHYLEEYWSNDVKYAFLSFRHGVAAMQAGQRLERTDIEGAVEKYRAAVKHFRRFRNTVTPTKRVLNNLGVAYARIGIIALADNGSPLSEWVAPLSIERETALNYEAIRETATRGGSGRPKVPVELRRAIKVLNEALSRDAGYARARANLAVVHLAISSPKKALAVLAKAKPGRGASAAKLAILRGVAQAELQDYEAAEAAFHEARRSGRCRALHAAEYNLARLYQLEGDKDQAETAYRSFVARWPRSEWASAAKTALTALD